MRVLITGGAGFIGSNLSVFHLKKKDEVFVIDNLITGKRENIKTLLSNKDFHFFENDICSFDFSSLSSFDLVYHLASPASPVQYKKHPIETLITNSCGTHRLLEFFHQSKSGSFVLASTSEVYGDPLVHPQKEDYWGNVNPVGARSCYDEGKRFAEALAVSCVRKYNINIRIARIFNTYGPNMEKDDGRVVSNFIVQALTSKPITVYGTGSQTRSFCYVSDMVCGLYLLATKAKLAGQIVNLGNPNEKTISELATIIKNLTGSKSEIVTKTIEADDPKKRKPDITKAQTLLGWTPKVNLEEGLVKTIKYFKEII
jgi:nucleoside-diphosphate-sugar epimerase